jgi:hypothetical protein
MNELQRRFYATLKALQSKTYDDSVRKPLIVDEYAIASAINAACVVVVGGIRNFESWDDVTRLIADTAREALELVKRESK